jgi:hypothetical protein
MDFLFCGGIDQKDGKDTIAQGFFSVKKKQYWRTACHMA